MADVDKLVDKVSAELYDKKQIPSYDKLLEIIRIQAMFCGWPRKLDNLTWCKMPIKLT